MILIRKCEKSDMSAIMNICYKTGYMGEDLTGLNQFDDPILFSYLFCYYYVRYETQNCFVAVDSEKSQIAGYIIGTRNTKKQKKALFLKMGWRIIFRLLGTTAWRHPETIKTVLYFVKNLQPEEAMNQIYDEYPAHLHINILKEYQRMGIGEKLLTAFEGNIRNDVKGIHLHTTSHNSKAIPFYHKMGYSVIKEHQSRMWKDVEDFRSILFAKSF